VPERAKRIRYLVPNSFTAISLLLGLFSIFFTLDGKLELAGWIIVWCAFFDKVDGIAARLLRATSNFGVEFDSFADFVAFGLAPGFLVYQHAMNYLVAGQFALAWLPPEQGDAIIWIFRVAVALYILCAGIRLATFNVRTAVLGPEWFYGIPSTFAGALIAAFLLTATKYGFIEPLQPYLPFAILPLGLLMLSPIKLPKIKARKSRAFNVFQTVTGALICIFSFLRMFPELLVLVGFGYLIPGIAIGLFSKKVPVPAAEPVAGAVPERSPARKRGGKIWWWRRKRGVPAEIKRVDLASGVVEPVGPPCAERAAGGPEAPAEPPHAPPDPQ
jgi:CDP-diacylglycerol--serine O-phosphatidyltransferase